MVIGYSNTFQDYKIRDSSHHYYIYSICIFIIRATKGLITHFNSGAESLLQYSASEMIGKYTPEIIHVKGELIERGIEINEKYGMRVNGFDILKDIASRRGYDSREWKYVRKDGVIFPVQMALSAIRNEQGTAVGFLEVATDISEIKSINHQLNQKNEELEQFAFIAAHDLQEPLRMISGFLSLLKQKYDHLLDDKGKQYVSYSVDGALRMRDIINDILDFSKSGTVDNIDLDLNNLVKGIVIRFQNEKKYKPAIFDIGMLPLIHADLTAMELLFTNLMGNGLKYQPVNNIPIIKITAEDIESRWLFKIYDNGIGIDPKHYEKVFAIFKRLHNKSEYSGTGIGLATCKKIVNLYNGDIWIESNYGKGSIFCFTISKL